MSLAYIGITTKSENQQPVKMVYPDGQFAIVNENGKLALLPPGKEQGMSIETLQAFASIVEAVAWVNEK